MFRFFRNKRLQNMTYISNETRDERRGLINNNAK